MSETRAVLIVTTAFVFVAAGCTESRFRAEYRRGYEKGLEEGASEAAEARATYPIIGGAPAKDPEPVTGLAFRSLGSRPSPYLTGYQAGYHRALSDYLDRRGVPGNSSHAPRRLDADALRAILEGEGVIQVEPGVPAYKSPDERYLLVRDRNGELKIRCREARRAPWAWTVARPGDLIAWRIPLLCVKTRRADEKPVYVVYYLGEEAAARIQIEDVPPASE